MYATHPTCPLALWARTASFTPDEYRRLDRDRIGLRIPAMRRTVFLVPSSSAGRVFAATRAPVAHIEGRLRRTGVSDADYRQLAQQILTAARQPRTSRDLQQVTGISGQALAVVLRSLRFEGRILALAGDSLSMSAHRYVATSMWIEEGLTSDDPAAALVWLAGEYLRAYGPARPDDFAWWAGVTRRAATKAVEPHDTVDTGDARLLLKRYEKDFASVRPLRNAVDLLPKWDPYTMAYAPDGRHRFVHPGVQQRVYTPIGAGLPGDGNPVVLVDGRAAGTWTFSLKGGADAQPFDTFGPRTARRIDEKLQEVAGLLAT